MTGIPSDIVLQVPGMLNLPLSSSMVGPQATPSRVLKPTMGLLG